MTDERTPRQEALLQYIYQYLLKHNGRPPTLNEMLSDKIAAGTKMGAFTSKSVLRYNLLQLEEEGVIQLLKDGSSRNIVVPGIVAGIPTNMVAPLDELEWFDYVLLDTDDWPNGDLPPSLAKTFLWDWTMADEKALFTVSNVHGHCYAWQLLDLNPGHHYCARRPYELLLWLAETGYFPEGCAVITDRHELRLAAVGMGVAVFGQKEAHGFEPPKRP